MGLTSEDWELINGCLLRLYRETQQDRHAEVMLEVLSELVHSDSSTITIYQPAQDLRFVSRPPSLTRDAVKQGALAYIHHSPFGPYYLATEDATWMRESDLMPIEDFHSSEWYQGFLKPRRIKYQIACILAVMEGTGYFVTLHREHRGFTERERTLLNTIHPHLVTSFVNAMAYSQAKDTMGKIKAVMETAPGAYGYFNSNGKLAWIQPKAQAWLLEFFPEEAKGEGNIPLSITRLRESSAQEGNAPKQLECTNQLDILTICLGPSALGGWILRLVRTLRTHLPRFRPMPQLSSRENDVLHWVVEGKRNAEIATILFVSPRTVEKHVAQILAKLGVENRATAIIRAMEQTAMANRESQ